jgi:RNA polymerase sigma-70 factor (ECF subfamily)
MPASFGTTSASPPGPDEQFMSEFLRVQPLLQSYLRMVVPLASDRDDIAQEVSIALWRNYADYDRGRPFLAWALGIARHHVARWRKTRAIARRRFSDETEIILAEAFAQGEDDLLQRRSALQLCVERLNRTGRTLIEQRYQAGLSLEMIASKQASSVNAINKALGKIRRLLSLCVDRSLAEAP